MLLGKQTWLIVGLLFWGSGAVAQPKKLFPVTIHFKNQVGSKLLYLDSTYTNPHGEAFTVRIFRYYISHLYVLSNKGKTYMPSDAYFLVDEGKQASKTITLWVPFPIIQSIGFTIGVDSSRNVSGVQTGALDPANGMFWTWNSGYIMAKLEGSSPVSKAPQNGFTYHIGGFRNGENAARRLSLVLPKTISATKDTVIIKADVNAWFNGVHPLKIADQPSIMTPGPQAMQIADNYSKMFSITQE